MLVVFLVENIVTRGHDYDLSFYTIIWTLSPHFHRMETFHKMETEMGCRIDLSLHFLKMETEMSYRIDLSPHFHKMETEMSY